MAEFFDVFDYILFAVYASILIVVGFYLKKKASGSLEDYFLGGRNMPWWLMGVAGMTSYLSLAGSMVIVSFLYYAGLQGLYIEFRGGACLILVVMLVWGGKWHRRSECITGAEFLKFRFGSDAVSQFSRISTVIVCLISSIGGLSLFTKGIGIFLSMFLPYSPLICSLVFFIIVTIYTIFAGFYGVVVTDVIQLFLIVIGVVFVSFLAIEKLSLTGHNFTELVYQATGNSDWFTSLPLIKAKMPVGYEAYQYVILFASFSLLNNVIFGTSYGGDSKQLACKTDKDCSRMTIMWIVTLAIRWPLMIAFVVLGMFVVKEMFTDFTQTSQAVAMIKSHIPGLTNTAWSDVVNNISINPDKYPGMASSLSSLLGDKWPEAIKLLDFYGNINGETIMPAVLRYTIPAGMRGVIMIALIATAMGPFNTAVNSMAGLFTRDVYQNIIRPNAKINELILASYSFSIVLVILGFMMAFTVRNVNDIWNWIVMSLATGLVVPSTLRYFWWRFNAWGFNAGLVFGALSAVLQRIFYPEIDIKIAYVTIFTATLMFSIITALLTKPTDSKVIENYYLKVRPFGFWGNLKGRLTEQSRRDSSAEHKRDIIALPFSLVAHVALMLCSMQAILMLWHSFFITLAVFGICVIVLYFVWYRHLDKMGYKMIFEVKNNETA